MKYAAMLLGLALLLAACDGAPTMPGTDEPARGPVITGTVVEEDLWQPTFPNLTLKAWSGGAGQVATTVVDDSGKTAVVATGSLNADGTFSVALPAAVASASLGSLAAALNLQDNPFVPAGLSCTAALVPSDTVARGAALLVAVTGQKAGVISPVTQSGEFNEEAQTGTLTIRNGAYVYSDRAVSVSGSQTCTGPYQDAAIQATLTSAVQLSPGWNTVNVTTNVLFDKSTVTLTTTSQTGALPTSQWLYSGGLGGLGLTSFPSLR